MPSGSAREWLVADGAGGYAMGTVTGLATRRYHGALVVASNPPGRRHVGLVSVDPVLVVGDRRVRLATHEWRDGTLAPDGCTHLEEFRLEDGLPVWRWRVDALLLEAQLAVAHGRPAVGIRYRLLQAPGPVGLELEPLCTWRDAHGERWARGVPEVTTTADGFDFEGAYRVRGPGFSVDGAWYLGLWHREEAVRGLEPAEDVWRPGRFRTVLEPGGETSVEAWARPLDEAPPPARALIDAARARSSLLVQGAADDVDASLRIAADRFVVAGPTVVAGYPWFGEWSRDTMTSYEGLFLVTGRVDEGRQLLLRSADLLSEGMLANTADAGETEYNTVDAALWLLHAAGRHVETTGDHDLAATLYDSLHGVVDHYVAGTRFGIRVDRDGLVTQGTPGWALTWMDARVEGAPVTARAGKPVEVNALWIRGLRVLAAWAHRVGRDSTRCEKLERDASAAFARRFPRPGDHGLFDVVDGPRGDDPSTRPNQLLAVSLPGTQLADAICVLRAVEPLVTSLGLRTLAPDDARYEARHRGSAVERDRAYHQGTAWPWLIGPYVDATLAAGRPVPEVVAGLEAHLWEWGLGSVSETSDADAPHGATGCPFQAWSVAELLRARSRLAAVG